MNLHDGALVVRDPQPYAGNAASWEAWRTDRADTSTRWTAQLTAREKVGTSTATKG